MKLNDEKWQALLKREGVSWWLHLGWFPVGDKLDRWGLIFCGSYLAFMERDR